MAPRMARGVSGLRRMPILARLAASSLPRQYRKDPGVAFDKQFGRDVAPCDRDAMADPSVRRTMLDAAVEATRQGSRGLATERQLMFSRPWGFDPADIRMRTLLWYGAEDTLAPPQMGEHLAATIPDGRLTVYPGEGHMALFTHWSEILRGLAAEVSAG